MTFNFIDCHSQRANILIPYRIGEMSGFCDTTGNIKISPDYESVTFFSTSFFSIVEKDGKFGVIDTNNRIIVPTAYDKLRVYKDTVFCGLRDSSAYILTKEGHIISSFKNIQEIYPIDNAVLLVNNRKYGIVNPKGKLVVNFDYDAIGLICTGLNKSYYKIIKNDKTGVINNYGETIIAPEYDKISLISDSLFTVTKENKKGIFLNNGKLFLPVEYDEITDYYAGLLKIQQDDMYGFIHVSSGSIIKPKYSNVKVSFNHEYNADSNFVLVTCENGHRDKTGFSDYEGKVFISCSYDNAYPFYEDLALVVNENPKHFYFINKNNKVVIDLSLKFSIGSARSFHEGVAILNENFQPDTCRLNASLVDSYSSSCQSDTWILININGDVIARIKSDLVRDFKNGVAQFYKKDKVGLLNKKGEQILPPKYDKISSFRDGIANIYLNDKVGVINSTGKILVEPNYDEILRLNNNLFALEDNGTWYYYRSKIKSLERLPFESISKYIFCEKYRIVSISGKDGLIDNKGQTVLKCEYESIILVIAPWLVIVKRNGSRDYLNLNGLKYYKD